MFSARLDWNLRPNRLSQALQDKRRRRVSILDLSESNPTRAALHYPAEEILRATPEVESYSRRTGARLALAIAEPFAPVLHHLLVGLALVAHPFVARAAPGNL